MRKIQQYFLLKYIDKSAVREYTYDITHFSVGEATAGIRVATAQSWRHDEKVNSLCRNQGME